MKKMTSLLLAVVMLVGTFCALPVFADGTSATVENYDLFHDDFSYGNGSRFNLGEHSADHSWTTIVDSSPALDFNGNQLLSGDTATNDVLWVWSTNPFAKNFENAVTSGKVLVSFDIKPYKTSGTAENMVDVLVASCDLEKDGTSSNLSTLKIAGVTAQAAGGIRLWTNGTDWKFCAGWADSGEGKKGAGFVGKDSASTKVAEAGKWYNASFLVDLDNQTVTSYINGEKLDTATNKMGISSIKSLIFDLQASNTWAHIDNVKVIQNPVMKVESVKTIEDKGIVDVKFTGDVTDDTVTATLKKGTETVEGVTATVNGDTVRVKAPAALALGKDYTVEMTVNSSLGTCNACESFKTALACVSEDFTDAAATESGNSYKVGSYITSKVAPTFADGVMTIKNTDSSIWSEVFSFAAPTSVPENEFIKIVRSIRHADDKKDGYNAFTASTTNLGTLSYEFDVKADTGTLLIYKNTRISRMLVGTAIFAGNADGNNTNYKVSDFAANTWYHVKVDFDFAAQTVTYTVNDTSSKTTNFSDTIYESTNTLNGVDMFSSISFGVASETTAQYDNFVVKYTADEPIVQNVNVTDGALKGQIVNPFDTGFDAYVMLGEYDSDNKLVNVDFDKVTVEAYGQNELEQSLTGTADGNTLKSFIWYANGLKPIAQPQP